ncbi:toxin-antitoxin system YwqK family antitoxin [Streptomyces sp. BRA346]|uniref:toxin-antitoxin system YwqK family antitoxin n=1 Tax=Streptomyces sp. BRA346 TaxID=2878199 RepID=UPI00406436CC
MTPEPEPGAGPAAPRVREDDLDSYEQDGPVYYRGERYTGEAEERLPDGTLITLTSYLDGRQDGLDREWYPDGTLKSEAHFRDGIPVGVHRTWRPDGTLSSEVEFTDGGSILRRDSHP